MVKEKLNELLEINSEWIEEEEEEEATTGDEGEEEGDEEEEGGEEGENDEDADDYFNPFGKNEEKEEEGGEKEEEGDNKKEKEEEAVPDPLISKNAQELKEVKATVQAQGEVAKLLKDNPEYADLSDDLVRIASQAIVQGHVKPIEFAIRNVRSPSYWEKKGRESGIESARQVIGSRIGGTSGTPTSGKDTDYDGMSSDDFNSLVNKTINQG